MYQLLIEWIKFEDHSQSNLQLFLVLERWPKITVLPLLNYERNRRETMLERKQFETKQNRVLALYQLRLKVLCIFATNIWNSSIASEKSANTHTHKCVREEAIIRRMDVRVYCGKATANSLLRWWWMPDKSSEGFLNIHRTLLHIFKCVHVCVYVCVCERARMTKSDR